jgi:predicted nucleic acid-binding Zn ribbon protein
MPSYDYSCENGHVTTETRSISEDSKLEVCATDGCESKVLSRVWTPVTAVYKGSGFYSTDKNNLLKPGQRVDW